MPENPHRNHLFGSNQRNNNCLQWWTWSLRPDPVGLMKLKVKHKGLFLITLPLVFILVFGIFLFATKRSSISYQEMSLHSKEVIAKTHTMLSRLLEAKAAIYSQIITGKSRSADGLAGELDKVPDLA